jgi:hypothetical protein
MAQKAPPIDNATKKPNVLITFKKPGAEPKIS